MINAKDKDQAYKTVPDRTYYHGKTIIDGDLYRLLMWNDLLGVEGTDRAVKMTFRLWDVTIKDSGLLQLIRDAQTPQGRHPHGLTAPPDHSRWGGGLVVKEIEVKVAQSKAPSCMLLILRLAYLRDFLMAMYLYNFSKSLYSSIM